MVIEYLLILTVMVVFAVIHGLARWRAGLAETSNPKVGPSYPGRDGVSLTRASFEPEMDVETEPQIEPAKFRRTAPLEPLSGDARGQRPRSPRQLLAAPVTPTVSRTKVHYKEVVPRNQAELRRAMVLVAIFGPPRALDPSR